MRARNRISLQPAYLLHHSPWRDSSRILEFFTRDHGRITLFARGVRRPGSSLGSVLLPFQRLLLSWSAHGEAGTFTGAEIDDPALSRQNDREQTQRTLLGGLPANRVMSGFYLNELILKLSARHDSHPQLFDDYCAAVEGLRSASSEERVLRVFEKRLLDSLGYGLDLAREAMTGAALDAREHYHYRPERGVVLAAGESPGTYCGASLSSLATEALEDDSSLKDARRLLREALASCLEGRDLKTREVTREMTMALKRYRSEGSA